MYQIMKKIVLLKTISATTIHHILFMLNLFYIRSDNRTLNNTSNISKNINQYTTDVVNNYKINKVPNLKICIICFLMALL